MLRTLLAQAPQKLAWSVLYDIDDKVYYLNLVPVVKAVIAPSGQRERVGALTPGENGGPMFPSALLFNSFTVS